MFERHHKCRAPGPRAPPRRHRCRAGPPRPRVRAGGMPRAGAARPSTGSAHPCGTGCPAAACCQSRCTAHGARHCERRRAGTPFAFHLISLSMSCVSTHTDILCHMLSTQPCYEKLSTYVLNSYCTVVDPQPVRSPSSSPSATTATGGAARRWTPPTCPHRRRQRCTRSCAGPCRA